MNTGAFPRLARIGAVEAGTNWVKTVWLPWLSKAYVCRPMSEPVVEPWDLQKPSFSLFRQNMIAAKACN